MSSTTQIPLPFQESEWPRKQREAVAAFWAWYHAVQGVVLPDDIDAAYEVEQEKERLRSGRAPKWVPLDAWGSAKGAAQQHGVDEDLLLRVLSLLATNGRPLHFADKAALYAHIEATLEPHARILAQMAGLKHSWQRKYITEFTRGFYVITNLVRLKQELSAGRIFIPLTDLEQADVTQAELQRGSVNENVRKLLWKQVIRAKDAFSHAQPLVQEVAKPYRRMVKRGWLGGLEVLGEIERRKYDVWTRPVTLSSFHQAQVMIQTRLGKAAFRAK